MKKLSAMFVVLLALAALIASPVAAAAQGRARGRVYTKVDVERLIKRVEERSDVFQKAVDRQLDHSRLNGTRREDRINAQVKEYERATDQLRREFDRRDRWMDTRGNVEKVLRQANDVNRIMHDTEFGRGVENEWRQLRSELNALADVYNLKPLR